MTSAEKKAKADAAKAAKAAGKATAGEATGPKVYTKGPNKGLPIPTVRPESIVQDSKEKVAPKENKAAKHDFPKDLQKAFALLRELIAAAGKIEDEDQAEAANQKINALRVHIGVLQNGTPAPGHDAKYIQSTFNKQNELGRMRRLENLARRDRDVKWLLENFLASQPKEEKKKKADK